jgi:hypothetical protein
MTTNNLVIEIPEDDSYSRVNSCPNESTEQLKKYRSSRTRNKLPQNFHKTLIELENWFSSNPTNETMQEILFYYKVNIIKLS